MIIYDWFEDYVKEEGIVKVIIVVVKCICFFNMFYFVVDDINVNRDEIEVRFLMFFFEFIIYIKINGFENIWKV